MLHNEVLVEVDYISHLTYDALGELTGMSRKLIAAGLKLLVELGPQQDHRGYSLEIGEREEVT